MITIKLHPVQAALEAARRFRYAEAKQILVEHYEKNIGAFEIGRMANLFEVGMLSEGVDALTRYSLLLEECDICGDVGNNTEIIKGRNRCPSCANQYELENQPEPTDEERRERADQHNLDVERGK